MQQVRGRFQSQPRPSSLASNSSVHAIIARLVKYENVDIVSLQWLSNELPFVFMVQFRVSISGRWFVSGGEMSSLTVLLQDLLHRSKLKVMVLRDGSRILMTKRYQAWWMPSFSDKVLTRSIGCWRSARICWRFEQANSRPQTRTSTRLCC